MPGTALAIFIAIGVGEEAGWTAFASARLLRRYSFLTAFGIIATVRVLWHVPLMLTGELPLLVGVVANAAFQFLVLWVYQRSGGVWLLAAIWHAVHNTLSGSFAFRLVAGADLTRLGLSLTVVYVAAAGAVLLFDRSVRAVGRPPGSGAAAAGDAGGR